MSANDPPPMSWDPLVRGGPGYAQQNRGRDGLLGRAIGQARSRATEAEVRREKEPLQNTITCRLLLDALPGAAPEALLVEDPALATIAALEESHLLLERRYLLLLNYVGRTIGVPPRLVEDFLVSHTIL